MLFINNLFFGYSLTSNLFPISERIQRPAINFCRLLHSKKMLLYLYSMGELAILLALIFDFRQRKTLVLQLLQFMFIVFPITMGLTILLFYPVYRNFTYGVLMVFPVYIPMLFLYKTIYQKLLGRLRKTDKTSESNE